MRKVITLLFCFCLAACGGNGGSDFVGTYQVTKHTLNDAACDAEGPEVTGGETHFKLEMGDLFGFPILQYFPCSSATECEDIANFGFAELRGEWLIQTQSSYELGGECHLGETLGSLNGTDLGVSIEVKTSEGVVTPAGGEECDPDLVDKYHDQMVCKEYEVVEGTLLE